MNKIVYAVLFTLLFCFSAAFPQELENVSSIEQAEKDELRAAATAAVPDPGVDMLPRFGIAAAETVLNNLVLYGLNVFLLNPYIRHDSSFPSTLTTIKRNVHLSSWDWDSDGFFINQILHPYQGAYNHAAGRANGFGFYESLGFDMFGSAVWEIFCETDRPSVNDFISSTLGGAASGEMLHRLYLEAADRHPGLALPISPVDGLNSAITGRRDSGGKKIQQLDLSFGVGRFVAARYSGDAAARIQSWNTVFPAAALTIVYGNPFTAESYIPYEHFELSLQGSVAPAAFSAGVLSDGYLFSFSLIDSLRIQASTGLSMHWDFLFGSNHAFSSHALDWTVKLRRALPQDIALEAKFHGGWSVFASEYFFTDGGQAKDWQQNYSTGVNGKLFFALSRPRVGTFSLSAAAHALFILPNTIDNSEGHSLIAFSKAAYEFPLADSLAVIIENRFDVEYGTYVHVSDVRRRTRQTEMRLGYHF